MKKNRMMRLASILLILVLMTSSVVGGTFAKYTTKVEGTDTARVARWGFTGDDADIAITDLFYNAYDKNVNGYGDVIAPGTTKSADFVFEYTSGTTDNVAAPEVAYTFTVNTTGSSCDENIKNNPNIQWAVHKKGEEPVWGTWDEMISDITELSGEGDGSKDYAARELPPISEQHTIEWQWIYNTNDAADAEDTRMGNLGNLDDVTIKITITATQID